MKTTVGLLFSDLTFAKQLAEKIKCYGKKYRYYFKTTCFQSPEDVPADQSPFDILVMDTQFKGTEKDGIQWAYEQNPAEKYYHLIYVSDQEERVFEAFKTGPIAFVRKEFLDDDLKQAVKIYSERFPFAPSFAILPEGRKRHFSMPDKIVYLHSNGHYIEIKFFDGTEKVIRGKMDVMEEVLAGYGFLRIHSSYLINLRYVKKVDRKRIFFSDEEESMISPKYREGAWERLGIYQYEEMT